MLSYWSLPCSTNFRRITFKMPLGWFVVEVLIFLREWKHFSFTVTEPQDGRRQCYSLLFTPSLCKHNAAFTQITFCLGWPLKHFAWSQASSLWRQYVFIISRRWNNEKSFAIITANISCRHTAEKQSQIFIKGPPQVGHKWVAFLCNPTKTVRNVIILIIWGFTENQLTLKAGFFIHVNQNIYQATECAYKWKYCVDQMIQS